MLSACEFKQCIAILFLYRVWVSVFMLCISVCSLTFSKKAPCGSSRKLRAEKPEGCHVSNTQLWLILPIHHDRLSRAAQSSQPDRSDDGVYVVTERSERKDMKRQTHKTELRWKKKLQKKSSDIIEKR